MNYEYMAMRGGYSAAEIEDPYSKGFVEGMLEAANNAAAYVHEYDDMPDVEPGLDLHERVANSVKREAADELAQTLRSDYYEALISVLDEQEAARPEPVDESLDEVQREKAAFVAKRLKPMVVAAAPDVTTAGYEADGAEELVRISYMNGARKRVCVTGDSLASLARDVLEEV